MKITEIDVVLRDPSIIVLDVREAAEVAEQGTLPGAIHIPIAELDKRIGELPRDKRILTA